MRGLATALILIVTLPATAELRIDLVPVADGLSSPVALAHAPGDADRLFVTEQRGRIRIILGSQVVDQPFLDITDRVRCCGEMGLLSVAFHPLYRANGQFYVNYTNLSGSTVISRFNALAGSPNRADPTSEKLLMTIAQPFSNHNGGQLQFGPDGYLYIGMGDGGSAGDPDNRAQNLLDRLGKMLRIDVDRGDPYAIPPDNPYAYVDNAQPEIWASGLRNPWRFSFDRLTGQLFIADVGQHRLEEVNVQSASSPGGENYGWRLMEGSRCYNPSENCSNGTLILPILEYSHDQGCSITGGYVYRGSAKRLRGIYFYGDFCAGTLWGAAMRGDGSWVNVVELRTTLSVSAFGEDPAGEIYVVDIGGRIFRLRDATPSRRRPVRLR